MTLPAARPTVGFAALTIGPAPVAQPSLLVVNSPLRASAHKPNTYSTVALRWSLSSGVARSFVREVALGPDAIAIYCLPLTSNVIGGAPNPAPTLILHSWLREVSSKAATVPSIRARNTSPPAVASAPE